MKENHNMKKILHICTGFGIDYNGGITNYVRCIAKEQSKRGNNVHILTDSGKEDGYKIISFNSKNESFSFKKRTDNKAFLFLKNLLEVEKYDLIHIHMCLNFDFKIFDLLKNEKYIVSLHDYFFICPRISMRQPGKERCEHTSGKCKNCYSLLESNFFFYKHALGRIGEENLFKFPLKYKKIYNKWISYTKPLLENAKILLPVSKRVEEIYINSGINNTYKTLHIGNISANDFDENFEYKNISNKINMVILSSFSEIKGGKLIESIIPRLNNELLQFHFYGRATDEQNKVMKSLNIINHGPYKQVDLKSILTSMDMGIMVPIWEDNGPQVVMEMLNNHLPVFATKMGGITDFVNDQCGFLFNPYLVEEVDKAVDFLNNLTIDQIKKFKSSIKRTVSPSEHFSELSKVYEKILDANYSEVIEL